MTKNIIIGDRVFFYDRDGHYADREMAGFLQQSPYEEDCWEFSGDGYDVWCEGSFAFIAHYIATIWKPRVPDQTDLIHLKLWWEFSAIEVGDLVCKKGQKVTQVISLRPKVEGKEQAFSCQKSNGEICRVNFKDWRDNIWIKENQPLA